MRDEVRYLKKVACFSKVGKKNDVDAYRKNLVGIVIPIIKGHDHIFLISQNIHFGGAKV